MLLLLSLIKPSARVWAPDMHVVADGIINAQTLQREHLAIYISLGEVHLQQPSAFAIDFSSFIYGSLIGRLLI